MTVKRIVFAGGYNTRSTDVNALSSASGIVGVGIVGVMIIGLSQRSSDKDRRFINCLPVTVRNEILRTLEVFTVKRPGFVLHTTPAAGNIGTAIHVWVAQGAGDRVMSAFGGTNSTLYDGTTSKGAITGKATAITETLISAVPTLAITSTDNTAWYYQDGGAVTKIVDGDFPGNAGKTLAGFFAHLDGIAFVMDTAGVIYASDLNSITAYTADRIVTADSIPDQGVGLIRHRNTIMAFCKGHFEIFRNAGNAAGSPLSRVNELTQLIGCVHADAITRIGDTVYWAGASRQGNISLYAYNGSEVKVVSKPEIDAQFVLAGPSNINLTAMGFYGRHFVVALCSNSTFVYCVEENNWHEWSTSVPLWLKADGVTAGTTMVNYTVTNKNTDGKVYVFSPANQDYRDNSVAYTAILHTEKYDLGTSRSKSFRRVDILADQETSASDLTITWTDDDYMNYSTARTVDLSASRPNLTRCGFARRRSFAFAHSANTPMRLQGMDVEFEVANT